MVTKCYIPKIDCLRAKWRYAVWIVHINIRPGPKDNVYKSNVNSKCVLFLFLSILADTILSFLNINEET